MPSDRTLPCLPTSRRLDKVPTDRVRTTGEIPSREIPVGWASSVVIGVQIWVQSRDMETLEGGLGVCHGWHSVGKMIRRTRCVGLEAIPTTKGPFGFDGQCLAQGSETVRSWTVKAGNSRNASEPIISGSLRDALTAATKSIGKLRRSSLRPASVKAKQFQSAARPGRRVLPR